MRVNLPNQITIARFALSIVFLILLAGFDFAHRDSQLWMLDWAFWLFVIAAGTDYLDGYLARKHNQVTSFGRILDPFVDKILVLGAFILLLGNGFHDAQGRDVTGLEAWMVVLIVSRELLVSGLRGFSEGQGKAYGANIWGKAKMVVQSITVGWLIMSVGRLRDVDWIMNWRGTALWVTVGFTALSVIAYLSASRDALMEQSR